MAPFREHCCEIVKLYYQTKSLKTVAKTMKKKYPEIEQLSSKQIQRIVKRFEESRSVVDRRHRNSGRPRSARTKENIEQVKTVIQETPQSAFFWLLALLVSSILWFAVKPLRETIAFGLVFSVIFQELFRFLFYKLLRKADEGLQKVSQQGQDQHVTPRDISNKHIMAYVSGLGFGIISGAFSLVNVLADMVGPGTIGIYGDSQYFFLASAFLTLCFVLLHTCWGVIFFNGLDKKQYIYVVLVVAAHMLVSCLSLLNQQAIHNGNYYLGSLLPAYALMLVMAVIAYHTAGGTRASCGAALSWTKAQRYAVE